MKKAAVLFIAVISIFFGGCTVFDVTEATTEADLTDMGTTSIVVVIPETTEALATEEPTAAVTEESTQEETTVFTEETSAEQTTASEEKTTKEEKTTASISEEVDLSISMPEKNGTMETDASPDNKYIKIVNKEKKIDKSLLLAVYSVPESGQNYVFEFYDAENSDADNIRRVYLIDSDGNIACVAATESSEKVNISPVENWFCMNVLIKEIIYPAVVSGE